MSSDCGDTWTKKFSLPNMGGNINMTDDGYSILEYSTGMDVWRFDLYSAPAVPSSVTESPLSSSRIALSWNAPSNTAGLIGYKVYRNNIFIASTDSTIFTDLNLAPGTAYSYSVTSYDSYGNESGKTAQSAASTMDAPHPPANLAVKRLSASRVGLSWAEPSGGSSISGYKIYRDGINISSTAACSFTDSGLLSGRSYTYYVSCFDISGYESLASASVSAAVRDEGVFAYPVPFTGGKDTSITITNIPDINSELSIYALDGTLILSSKVDGSEYTFAPTGLCSGVYIYVLKSDRDITRGKLVIIK